MLVRAGLRPIREYEGEIFTDYYFGEANTANKSDNQHNNAINENLNWGGFPGCYIESLGGEWPGQWFCFEFRCWSVWSAGELLACNAAPHDVFSVSHGGRPVEPCSKGFGHKCVTARVMSADALVDLEQ